MSKSNSQPRSGHYNANYGSFQTELYAQIRQEAFGEDIGQQQLAHRRRAAARIAAEGRLSSLPMFRKS